MFCVCMNNTVIGRQQQSKTVANKTPCIKGRVIYWTPITENDLPTEWYVLFNDAGNY